MATYWPDLPAKIDAVYENPVDEKTVFFAGMLEETRNWKETSDLELRLMSDELFILSLHFCGDQTKQTVPLP